MKKLGLLLITIALTLGVFAAVAGSAAATQESWNNDGGTCVVLANNSGAYDTQADCQAAVDAGGAVDGDEPPGGNSDDDDADEVPGCGEGEASEHNPNCEGEGEEPPATETVTETITVEVPGPTVTETVTETATETVTVTLPAETVTLPGDTITLPGDTVTLPGDTVTLPGETVTITKVIKVNEDGSKTVEVLPDEPKGTAFTGPENVVPLAAGALLLLTLGSGLFWLSNRKKV